MTEHTYLDCWLIGNHKGYHLKKRLFIRIRNHAIWIKQRLYARKGKRNYAFQNEQDYIYHGYIANDLGDDILKELYKRKWD